MSSPRVSILLPARDAEATLRRAVESCLAQTFGDFELLLVDDHSRDATPDMVRELARDDSRVVPLNAPSPGGLVPALRLACDAAHGSLLARMDADDACHPERLARQVALMEERPDIAACGCGARVVGTRGDGGDGPAGGFLRYMDWVNGLVQPERIAAERFVESPLVHPTAMMHREALAAVGGYLDPPWPEDYDLWLRMIDAGMKLAKAPEVLYDWTDGPSRLTRTDGRYHPKRFQDAKAFYLARLPALRERGVAICGAGPTGKRLARLLQAEGIEIRAFYDVHPRRIGERVHGAPVLPDEELPAPATVGPFLLAAAGGWEASERLEARLSRAGHVAGVDYFRTA